MGYGQVSCRNVETICVSIFKCMFVMKFICYVFNSIMFPLMKLEFVSLLERQYNLSANVRKYKVTLEYVTANLDRLMLVTKCK